MVSVNPHIEVIYFFKSPRVGIAPPANRFGQQAKNGFADEKIFARTTEY